MKEDKIMADDKQELRVNQQQAPDKRDNSPDRQGGSRSGGEDTRSILPRVDVLEDGNGITLLADMPGVPKEQLELKVEGNTLLIEGAISAPAPQQMEAIYVEVRVPRYRRAFTLSRELDPAGIQASLKDGVLQLLIPKHEQAKPRRIEIGVS
jgi:HSP20 family molecular chaperone IbpA